MKSHIILSLIVLFTACEKKKGSDEESQGSQQITLGEETEGLDKLDDADLYDGATLSVEVKSSPVGTVAVDAGLNLQGSTNSYGQNTAAQLKSMKYYFIGIQICESLEVQGSAFNNPKGCIDIYSGMDPDTGQAKHNYEEFDVAAAKANTEDYIDLMEPESVKRLSSAFKLEGQDAREYNYGLITWMKPIKVTASVDLPNGKTLYTKDGETRSRTIGDDNYTYEALVVDNITTAPAEESVVLLNNGGSFFKFTKPLVISKEDIENKVKFKLALAFNPDGIIKGSNRVDNYEIIGVEGTYPDSEPDYEDGYSIHVPMLALSPLAYQDGDIINVESYHIKTDDEKLSDVRLDLYYRTSDRVILGVESEEMFTSLTEERFGNIRPYHVVDKGNGMLDLLDWQKKPIVSDFTRLDGLGDSESLVIHDDSDISATYELVTDEAL